MADSQTSALPAALAAPFSTVRAFGQLKKYADVLIAVGVMFILSIMVVPLPPFVMDFLLAANITISLLVLVIAMYFREPLEFSVFPGLLLITTLFRLSLNIASTRLILSEGYAGEVITAFGNFVIRGNYVVGFVIFIILVVIQFVVITKGAGRIAEVAARFTLDAMPGKQMAIDADLNAGIIDEAEARRRRSNIAREADFYGAMDGASKFVRGDAVASVIITVINVVGGLIIGVAQRGLEIGAALQTYTLLSVGDGLVTQIPALVISTAAGLVVTRAASEENLGSDLASQIFGQPRPLYIAAGALGFFGLTPGMPAIPFFVLAAIVGGLARTVERRRAAAAVETEKKKEAAEKPEGPENVEKYLHVDPLELEVGYSLIPLVDPQHGGDLLHRITVIRRQAALEQGIVVPPIRIRDNIQLKPEEYLIKIRGDEVGRGQLRSGNFLALDSGRVTKKLPGVETRDPAFGLPALWIRENKKSEAETAGYTVVELPAVLTTHLKEILKNHAHLLVGRQETHNLIQAIKKDYPTVVEELIPGQLSVGAIQKILQNLLRERVSIRDFLRILEAAGDHVHLTKDPDVLTEYVRAALGSTLHKQYVADDGKLHAVTLDPQLERLIGESLRQGDAVRRIPALAPEVIKHVYGEIKRLTDQQLAEGYPAVVLTTSAIRLAVRRLIENVFPAVAVLSLTELPTRLEIKTVGVVKLEHAN
jgi:flagellar biosynthesis protein FlhA